MPCLTTLCDQSQTNRTGDEDDGLVTCSASTTWLFGVWHLPSMSGNTKLQSATLDKILCSFGDPKGVPSESGGEYGDSIWSTVCTKQTVQHNASYHNDIAGKHHATIVFHLLQPLKTFKPTVFNKLASTSRRQWVCLHYTVGHKKTHQNVFRHNFPKTRRILNKFGRLLLN